ncbi:hypothetical protein HYH03_000444 [Edaphochlamys debaryana]|uniref:Guanylate cyclase domain-containing protein n=1 Tax=Edaphochlamys debaryana TaxID=47281 RepID=A0A835YG57_9CHLO|nr:hypothetical protein HYH03_000444 [Edaphochlamys debaryana]|eukprot:KAG2501946.1 hypothetical protein HYH03_000444 [Edaphochlamys debaryana]
MLRSVLCCFVPTEADVRQEERDQSVGLGGGRPTPSLRPGPQAPSAPLSPGLLAALFGALPNAVAVYKADGTLLEDNAASRALHVRASTLSVLFARDPGALAAARAEVAEGGTWRGLLLIPPELVPPPPPPPLPAPVPRHARLSSTAGDGAGHINSGGSSRSSLGPLMSALVAHGGASVGGGPQGGHWQRAPHSSGEPDSRQSGPGNMPLPSYPPQRLNTMPSGGLGLLRQALASNAAAGGSGGAHASGSGGLTAAAEAALRTSMGGARDSDTAMRAQSLMRRAHNRRISVDVSAYLRSADQQGMRGGSSTGIMSAAAATAVAACEAVAAASRTAAAAKAAAKAAADAAASASSSANFAAAAAEARVSLLQPVGSSERARPASVTGPSVTAAAQPALGAPRAPTFEAVSAAIAAAYKRSDSASAAIGAGPSLPLPALDTPAAVFLAPRPGSTTATPPASDVGSPFATPASMPRLLTPPALELPSGPNSDRTVDTSNHTRPNNVRAESSGQPAAVPVSPDSPAFAGSHSGGVSAAAMAMGTGSNTGNLSSLRLTVQSGAPTTPGGSSAQVNLRWSSSVGKSRSSAREGGDSQGHSQSNSARRQGREHRRVSGRVEASASASHHEAHQQQMLQALVTSAWGTLIARGPPRRTASTVVMPSEPRDSCDLTGDRVSSTAHMNASFSGALPSMAGRGRGPSLERSFDTETAALALELTRLKPIPENAPRVPRSASPRVSAATALLGSQQSPQATASGASGRLVAVDVGHSGSLGCGPESVGGVGGSGGGLAGGAATGAFASAVASGNGSSLGHPLEGSPHDPARSYNRRPGPGGMTTGQLVFTSTSPTAGPKPSDCGSPLGGSGGRGLAAGFQAYQSNAGGVSGASGRGGLGVLPRVVSLATKVSTYALTTGRTRRDSAGGALLNAMDRALTDTSRAIVGSPGSSELNTGARGGVRPSSLGGGGTGGDGGPDSASGGLLKLPLGSPVEGPRAAGSSGGAASSRRRLVQAASASNLGRGVVLERLGSSAAVEDPAATSPSLALSLSPGVRPAVEPGPEDPRLRTFLDPRTGIISGTVDSTGLTPDVTNEEHSRVDFSASRLASATVSGPGAAASASVLCTTGSGSGSAHVTGTGAASALEGSFRTLTPSKLGATARALAAPIAAAAAGASPTAATYPATVSGFPEGGGVWLASAMDRSMSPHAIMEEDEDEEGPGICQDLLDPSLAAFTRSMRDVPRPDLNTTEATLALATHESGLGLLGGQGSAVQSQHGSKQLQLVSQQPQQQPPEAQVQVRAPSWPEPAALGASTLPGPGPWAPLQLGTMPASPYKRSTSAGAGALASSGVTRANTNTLGTLTSEAEPLALPLSPAGSTATGSMMYGGTAAGGGGAPPAPFIIERWHEVAVSGLTHPDTREPLLVVVQSDVSARVWAERQLAMVVEAEHTLLEAIFPAHVIEHVALVAASAAVNGMGDHTETLTLEGPGTTLLDGDGNLITVPEDLPSDPPGYAPPQAGRFTPQPSPGLANAARPAAAPVITGDTFLHLSTSHASLTVLFCDIQGFTAMCGVVKPATVMAFLNDLYTRLDSMLDAYGVYKVETIGDCYMVAGGLMRVDEETGAVTVRSDDVDPQHANRTVQFAKAILKAASAVRLPTTGEPVRLRVGIHSGPAMSGVVGTRMPRFCLFGDTVNTASRMESTGSAGAIHVSQATRDAVPHEPWEATGGVEAKGKGLLQTYLLKPARL